MNTCYESLKICNGRIETLDYALNYDEIISQYQIILSSFFPKLNKKRYHASQQRQMQLHLL